MVFHVVRRKTKILFSRKILRRKNMIRTKLVMCSVISRYLSVRGVYARGGRDFRND